MKTTEQVKRKAAELQEPLAKFFHSQLDADVPDEVDELRIIDALAQYMMWATSDKLHRLKDGSTAGPPPFLLSPKFESLKAPLEEFFRKHLTAEYGDEVDQLRCAGYLWERMAAMADRELKAIELQQEMEDKRRIIVSGN